jgi:hypothetical protein
MKTEITINNLIGGVATFNADPFEIATEETAQNIINSIEEYGVEELTDENDIEVAKAQLDLDDNDERQIYLAHDCKFALRK